MFLKKYFKRRFLYILSNNFSKSKFCPFILFSFHCKMYHQQTRKNICKARIANIKPLLIWQDFCNLENSSDICTNIEFKEIVQKLYCYYLWLMQFYKISSFDWLIVVCKPSNFKLLIHNFKWQTTRGEFFLKIRTDLRV